MKIIDMITGGGPLAILEKIDQDKASIRVEVEGSNLQFVSRLSVKGESVLIAKPPGLNQGLEKGKFVRFKVPGGGSHEIRLEIAAPHFNLNSGATVFLCRLPEKIIKKPPRKESRYNTTRFNNILLHIPGIKEGLRIIDLSEKGCRAYVPDLKLRNLLELGKPLPKASISLGDRARIDIEALTPRSPHHQTIGFEISLGEEAGKILQHMLAALEKAEESFLAE